MKTAPPRYINIYIYICLSGIEKGKLRVREAIDLEGGKKIN